jgi:hypothetical protein
MGVGRCDFFVPLFLVTYLYFGVPMAGPLFTVGKCLISLLICVSYFYFECCFQ